MKTAARDIEHSFIQGAYNAGANITTPRKTRGMLAAVSTNEVAGGAAALTQAKVESALKKMADSGAPFEMPVIFFPKAETIIYLFKCFSFSTKR